MYAVEKFGMRLCKECNIPYKPCLGMTDDILAIGIDDNDDNGKSRLRDWLRQHHWEFVRCDDRQIKINEYVDIYVHHKEVIYKHNNHKIIIDCID